MIINNIEEMSIEDIDEALALLGREKISREHKEYVSAMEKIKDVISKIPSNYKGRGIVINEAYFDWDDLEEAMIGLIKDEK